VEAIDLHKEVLRVRPFLEPALPYGGNTHDFVHIVQGVISGNLMLWPTENAAIVTEFHNFPNKRMLHIFLAGGDLSEIKQLHDDVVRFAKEVGCAGLSLTGRVGWIRALSDLGFGDKGLRYVTKEFGDE
jgi:hypothetical protein